MADEPNTPLPSGAWTHLVELRNEFQHRLASEPESDRWEIEDTVAVIEDTLLRLHASTVPAVILKLEVLWEAKLHGQDHESQARLAILEDLRIINEQLTLGESPRFEQLVEQGKAGQQT